MTQIIVFFLNMTQRIRFFLTQRIFFFNMTQRIEFLNYDSKELNLFFLLKYDSKELSFFLKYDSKRIESFFPEICLKRIEPFCFEYDSRKLNLSVLNMIQENWFFLFWIWFKELNFLKWLKELYFFQYDSKNWKWLKGLNLFCFNMTQRSVYIFFNMTQRIEPFLENDSKNSTFFQYDSKNWTHFLNMFQWIEPFASRCDSKSWTLFLKRRHDSKNWSFYEYDAKSWTLLRIWLKELNPILNMSQWIWTPFLRLKELNFFFQYDSKKIVTFNKSMFQKIVFFL